MAQDQDRLQRFVMLLHGPVTAWLVLVCGLLITGLAWKVSRDQTESRLRERLLFQTEEIAGALEARVRVYEQVLWGGVGLFKASAEVDRDEWKLYVDTLKIDERWPGIQGLGWAVKVDRPEKQVLEERIREEGFPDFSIHPESERDWYSAILYLEPFDWRNRRAFGYDMASNDVRYEAMVRAAQTGEASTSGKITLVQETEQDVQSGFLTYVPVYASEQIPESPEQRMAKLKGWVYAPFRAGDLMDGILSQQHQALGLEVFDGTDPSAASLLHDTDDVLSLGREDLAFSKQRRLRLQGRDWTLHFSAESLAQEAVESRLPTIVATTGFVIDLLLFYLITALVGSRRKAESLVQARTAELSAKSQALVQLNEELRRSNQDLAQFAEITSHDLKEPLRTISSYSELVLLREDEKLEAESRQYLTHVVEAARRMADLLRDTLTYSQLRQENPRKTTIDCASLVQQVLRDHADLIERQGVDVQVGELPVIQTSPLLAQVFTNLIVNAVNYRKGESGHVWVEAHRDGDQWRFSVSDDGLGVEAEHREKIFGLFQRLHAKESFAGTGLGLAICHRVVTSLGGRIWVEDREPQGSRFVFTVPAE